MTNKHASKQHCLVGNIRPKSKLRKRRNKALARARKEELLAKRDAVVKNTKPAKEEKKIEEKEKTKEAVVKNNKEEAKS